MYNSPIAAAAQSPYDQQGLYQQQHQDQSPKVMGMTQDLHNLLGESSCLFSCYLRVMAFFFDLLSFSSYLELFLSYFELFSSCH